ncbi:hypothetical protein B4U79_18879 [Dinothrombium tinctorium]|uniref:DNA-directed DNA polymerase n=1 Tax=Dinothrombium tinctorium TaxID=1965070 RepID=A0A3S3NG90_9ACAR|nr:hypothetical protein B4U79_18879 [Dinothrombium tinctorium]
MHKPYVVQVSHKEVRSSSNSSNEPRIESCISNDFDISKADKQTFSNIPLHKQQNYSQAFKLHGGLVLDILPCRHTNVSVFDFVASYPNIIIANNIGFETTFLVPTKLEHNRAIFSEHESSVTKHKTLVLKQEVHESALSKVQRKLLALRKAAEGTPKARLLKRDASTCECSSLAAQNSVQQCSPEEPTRFSCACKIKTSLHHHLICYTTMPSMINAFLVQMIHACPYTLIQSMQLLTGTVTIIVQ